MVDRTIIYKALAQHLQTNFSEPNKVAWENVEYKTEDGVTWFRETFLPNDSTQVTLGQSGYIRDFGLYQIDVCCPYGRGTQETLSFVDEISNIYKHGTTIVKDGYDVHISSCTPAQSFKIDTWWVTPITISWSCDMTLN